MLIGFALGGTTGYAINPARDLGPRLAHFVLPIKGKGSSDWAYAWVPIAGPFLGSLLGASSYRILYMNDLQPKYLINADNFTYDYVKPDDHWDNYWRTGPNAILGWGPGTGSGVGAKSLGQELANSDAFARCQVTKAYRTVCLGEPRQDQLDMLKTTYLAGFNMKNVFAEAATLCMGD